MPQPSAGASAGAACRGRLGKNFAYGEPHGGLRRLDGVLEAQSQIETVVVPSAGRQIVLNVGGGNAPLTLRAVRGACVDDLPYSAPAPLPDPLADADSDLVVQSRFDQARFLLEPGIKRPRIAAEVLQVRRWLRCLEPAVDRQGQ